MDDIVAATIHDAKNGLAALDALLDRAKRDQPSALLDAAQSQTRRINAQLVELLALYRDGNGALRLAVDDHDLSDFCADLGIAMAHPAEDPVRLEFDVSATATVIGAWAFDAYQVQLVLLDALRNALRHARSRVSLRLEHLDRSLCFEIADDGLGFPAEILAGRDTAMGSSGSGLGLRFARLIAERHCTPDGRCGRIELFNREGAVYRLWLP